MILHRNLVLVALAREMLEQCLGVRQVKFVAKREFLVPHRQMLDRRVSACLNLDRHPAAAALVWQSPLSTDQLE